jgi:hypothetical protein
MKTKTPTTRADSPGLRAGQLWQMDGASLQIELVGKRLVHYKHFKLKEKRPPVRLSRKSAVEQLIDEQGAVLVQETPPPAPARSESSRRRKASR